MKILIYVLILAVLAISCGKHSDDLKFKGYEYVVIDTTSVSVNDTTSISVNGFNEILGCHVIVEHNSTLYSAWMNDSGIITKLDRKLKVKK